MPEVDYLKLLHITNRNFFAVMASLIVTVSTIVWYASQYNDKVSLALKHIEELESKFQVQQLQLNNIEKATIENTIKLKFVTK